MTLAAAYGLCAHALIFGALVALLPLGQLRPKAGLMATTLALLVGIAPALHGIFGPPSLTLVQLAVLQLANRSPSPLSFRPALGIVLFAGVFYATSLGVGPFDPYALGFQPWAVLAALLPLAAALWWRGLYAGLWILAIDLAGYAAGLVDNLWDALLDPLLVILALVLVIRRGVLVIIARRNR
jgi:hypothetical protein